MTANIIYGLIIGFVATAFMDGTNQLLGRLRLVHPFSPILLGRMGVGWLKGRFFYGEVSKLEVVSKEKWIGWVVHYFIGSILGSILLFSIYLFQPRVDFIVWPIVYGILTTTLPWFYLFPAMGFGLLGLKAPKELKIVRTSSVNHFNFGVGLTLGIIMLQKIFGISLF